MKTARRRRPPAGDNFRSEKQNCGMEALLLEDEKCNTKKKVFGAPCQLQRMSLHTLTNRKMAQAMTELRRLIEIEQQIGEIRCCILPPQQSLSCTLAKSNRLLSLAELKVQQLSAKWEQNCRFSVPRC